MYKIITVPLNITDSFISDIVANENQFKDLNGHDILKLEEALKEYLSKSSLNLSCWVMENDTYIHALSFNNDDIVVNKNTLIVDDKIHE